MNHELLINTGEECCDGLAENIVGQANELSAAFQNGESDNTLIPRALVHAAGRELRTAEDFIFYFASYIYYHCDLESDEIIAKVRQVLNDVMIFDQQCSINSLLEGLGDAECDE